MYTWEAKGKRAGGGDEGAMQVDHCTALSGSIRAQLQFKSIILSRINVGGGGIPEYVGGNFNYVEARTNADTFPCFIFTFFCSNRTIIIIRAYGGKKIKQNSQCQDGWI